MPYEVGLDAVEELKKLVPAGATMAQFALRWILMNEAVTVVIPGAKNKAQAEANSAAASLPALSADVMAAAKKVYDDAHRQACASAVVASLVLPPPLEA